MKQRKPILQVTNQYNMVKCQWLKPDEEPIGTERYLHSDCVIFFKGSRNRHTDYAVMLALQDAHMPAGKLVYVKGGR